MDGIDKSFCGRENEIIEAAQKVFTEFGYKKVTMDDVAAKLNITRSALYYYYKSKDDLFIAVTEKETGIYRNSLNEAVASAKTTDERFAAFVHSFLPMRKKFRDVYQLASEDFTYPAEIQKKLRSLIDEIHGTLIIDIFRKDKKISSIENLDYYATLLTYSIRGVVFYKRDEDLNRMGKDAITLCRIFCSGLPGVASAVRADTNKNDSVKKENLR